MSDTPVKAQSGEDKAVAQGFTKKKRGLAFRIARGLFVAFFATIALVAAFLFYLTTSSGKARVRAFLVAKLGEKVDGKVEIAELDYSLAGGIHVGGLKLIDRNGDPGVALDSLTIEPSWDDLVHGRVIIKKVALSGLRLHVTKLADGTTSLDHYLHFEKPEPADKRIIVRSIDLHDVGVIVDQPDGTRLSVEHFALAGNLEAVPRANDADVEIEPITLDVHVEKPGGALSLGVVGLKTGLSAHVRGGLGTVTLHPTSATLVVDLPDMPEKKLDIALGASTFDIGKGTYGASIESLLAGAIGATSIEIHAATEGDKIAGTQRADVIGVHLDAARANALIGQDLLASDVDVEAHVSGPPDKIALDATVKTAGGNVGLKGSVGLADMEKPTYDLTLVLDGVASKRLLASALPVPPASLKRATIHLVGAGRSIEKITADATIHVEGVEARGIVLDDVSCDAHVEDGRVTLKSLDIAALEQKVHVDGAFDVDDKHLDMNVAVGGDPGRAVEILKAAGIPVDVNLPKGLLVLAPNDLKLGLRGRIDGDIDVTVASPGLAFAGGKLGLDGHATVKRLDPPVDGKAVDVKSFDAHVTLAGVSVPAVLALQGKALPGLNAWANGTIDASGSPSDPNVTLNLDVTAVRAGGGGPKLGVHVGGLVDKTKAWLTVRGKRGDAPLFDAEARVPLALQGEPKGLDAGGPLSVHLAIAETSFDDLLDMVPGEMLDPRVRAKIPPGSVVANVDVSGTLAQPKGTFDVDVKTDRIAIPGVPAIPSRRVHLTGSLDPDGRKTKVVAKAEGWLDMSMAPLVSIDANASFQGSPILPGPKQFVWNVGVDVPTIALATVPLNDKRLKNIGGKLAVGMARSTERERRRRSARCTSMRTILTPNGGGPVDIGLAVELKDDGTTVTGTVDLAKSLLLRIDGGADLAGRGLIAKVRTHVPLDPKLDVKVDMPSRPVASLASLRPPLASVPGNLRGHIDVTGTATEPLAKATVDVDGFTAANGEPSRVALAIDAGRDELAASINVGTGNVPPIRIEAHAPRAGVNALLNGGELPVTASVRAGKADLRALLPTFALDKAHGLGVRGELDWNMDFSGALASKDGELKLQRPLLDGSLDLESGEIDLPGTKRTYKDVTLRLSAASDGLHIDDIGATESDLEISHRWIAITGNVAWHDLVPTSADIDLKAGKWLLFGTKTIGLADAPRGSLTIDAHASSALDGAIKKATVEVKSLEVLFPDRYDKSHQPEDAQIGDVLYVGDKGPDGNVVESGKLPVPAPPEAEKTASNDSDASAEESGIDIDIRIDPGARLMQAPIELKPEGDVHIESRASGRKVRGVLDMKGGLLGARRRGSRTRRRHVAVRRCAPGRLAGSLFQETREELLRFAKSPTKKPATT